MEKKNGYEMSDFQPEMINLLEKLNVLKEQTDFSKTTYEFFVTQTKLVHKEYFEADKNIRMVERKIVALERESIVKKTKLLGIFGIVASLSFLSILAILVAMISSGKTVPTTLFKLAPIVAAGIPGCGMLLYVNFIGNKNEQRQKDTLEDLRLERQNYLCDEQEKLLKLLSMKNNEHAAFLKFQSYSNQLKILEKELEPYYNDLPNVADTFSENPDTMHLTYELEN